MHKSKIKQISLAVCMAFMPIVGYTAGLGKLNVNSGLGEPLKVEIELLSVTAEELSTLTASIASEEAYNVQGITRLGIHNNIKVDLAKSNTGAPVLRIRSNTPINDPYLDMLIQVDWASGRLLREYTVLLDPPEYKRASNSVADFAPVNQPSANVRSNGSASDSSALSRNTKKSNRGNSNTTSSESNTSKDSEQKTSDATELTTKRGDTLASIAQKMQVEGVSLDQMLVGLFESNKSAFINSNMNQLKVGQIIKAPSADTLAAINPDKAKQTLKVHAANWNAYRNTLAGNVKTTLASDDNEPKQSASGKIASAEDKSATVKSGVQDVVKLSAGDKATPAGAKVSSTDADAKLSALQEEAVARENMLKESLSRATALEKQIEDMQKLLALKSQTMTELQKNAEVTPEPDTVKPVVAEVKPKAEPAEQPKALKDASQAVAPVSEPTFFESLTNSLDIKLLGGISALLALGAGWLFLRNKRRRELDSFERGILTSGGLRANTVFGNTTGNSSTSDTSFLTDFAQSADGSMIDTNDVDPIAEAEVYMAYGRDAQAEEILKDALVKEPKRYELHLKLLEMYAGRKDVSAFEAIAGELYTTLGAGDPTWAKVAEMGGKLEPENPLYELTHTENIDLAVAPISAYVSEDNSFNPSSLNQDSLNQITSDASEIFSSQDTSLDFSLDDEPVSANVKSNNVVTTDITPTEIFSADISNSLNLEAALVNNQHATQDADNSLEFDLGDVNIAPASEVQANKTDDFTFASAVDDALASGDEHSLEFTIDANDSDDLASATPSEIALTNDKDAFDVPSFLDTAPNIEFADIDPPVNETVMSSLATEDNGLMFNESEPLTFEMPDAAIEISFNTPLDLDKNEDVDFSNLLQTNDLVLSSDNQEATADEVNFDFTLDSGLELPPTEATVPEKELLTNDFDFAAIDLDLTGDAPLATEISDDYVEPEIMASSISENQDVDIKLDLVSAYIDMDDKEGARELLEEVLKEGGTQQKLRAEQLLASL